MVQTAPKFHEIAKRIIEITEGTTLVGHNIDFDYRMLRQSFQRLGYEFKINTLDTIPLARKLIPDAESYSLGKLVKSLGIPITDQHRAGGDARATLELFKLLISKDKESEIIQKQYEESNAKTYVNKVRDLTQDLPAEKGIIYFQNADGKIIFSDFAEDIGRYAKKLFNSQSKRYDRVQTESVQIHFEKAQNPLAAKLMMKAKGISKKETLPFGLFFRNEKFFAEKTALRKNEKPLLKFRSYTQASKVLTFIKKQENLTDFENLTEKIILPKDKKLLISQGRTMGEKMYIIMENQKISAFGFYDLYTQIQTLDRIEKLKIDLPAPTSEFNNDIQLALLRGDMQILPMPEQR